MMTIPEIPDEVIHHEEECNDSPRWHISSAPTILPATVEPPHHHLLPQVPVPSPHASSILYQLPSLRTFLIDLPLSIQLAQSFSPPSSLKLVSTPPIQLPHPSLEPKSPLKRQKLLSTIPEKERLYQDRIRGLLAETLGELRTRLEGNGLRWCLGRLFRMTSGSLMDEGQSWDGNGEKQVGRKTAVRPQWHTRTRDPGNVLLGESQGWSTPPVVLSSFETSFPSLDSIYSTIFCNQSSLGTVRLKVASDQVFLIPPQSTFLFSSIRSGIPIISNWASILLSPITNPGEDEIDGKFDFVLLDPPWSNRSVQNARAKTYQTPSKQYSRNHDDPDPFTEVLPLLTTKGLLRDSSIVAVWITNKPSIRTCVLEALSNLGMVVFEEWIWAKVTIHGEPVTDLEGIWRRPWEVLLLFRFRPGSPTSPPAKDAIRVPDSNGYECQSEKAEEEAEASPQRRVVIAVPDMHSRKPCLKELLEKTLLRQGEYQALEVFARSLTAGWWAWGDEVLKFNSHAHWSDDVNAT